RSKGMDSELDDANVLTRTNSAGRKSHANNVEVIRRGCILVSLVDATGGFTVTSHADQERRVRGEGFASDHHLAHLRSRLNYGSRSSTTSDGILIEHVRVDLLSRNRSVVDLSSLDAEVFQAQSVRGDLDAVVVDVSLNACSNLGQ